LKSAFTEPKIYGIAAEKAEIVKMLQNVGLLTKEDSQVVSKLPEHSKVPENRSVFTERPANQ
jgi:hypothetical protein